MKQIVLKINRQKYILYNNGSIFSKQKNKFLKLHNNSKGYFHVKLWDGNKTIQKYIHILVASYFIPNPMYKPEVNHKDGIKAHNFETNLEWSTHKENMEHARKIGLFKQEEINKQNNQQTWLGQKNSTRMIIGLTHIKNKTGNYKVLVKCNCGHELLMYHNDFKKDHVSCCIKCRSY